MSFFHITLKGQTYLTQDFSSGEMPPEGWTIEDVEDKWTAESSSIAGGTSPEARFEWVQLVGTTKLISPQIDLSGLESIYLDFNHMYDYYLGDGPAIGVATRSGNGVWTSIWQVDVDYNVGPETVHLEIVNDDVGQIDFQFCFYVIGDFYNLDYWYLDDIFLFLPMEIEIKMFLQGPFENSYMLNQLNLLNYLPLDQPYNYAPWNYYGTESVNAIPNENIIDWVLVSLVIYDPESKQTHEIYKQQAAFLRNDGKITGLDGTSNLIFHIPETDSLYVLINHRNHLSVMSADPLIGQNGFYVYDFTSDSSKAESGKYIMVQLSDNEWGIASGDGNADGQIDNLDKDEIWVSDEAYSGYLFGDFNMDGLVNESDIVNYWNSNGGMGHWKPDTLVIPFECGTPLIDERDGNSYETVQIGNQCWMKENLNYETGSSLCYYNSSSYCDIFGRLYDWSTIMAGSPGSNAVPSGVQGICPEEWHLPSDAEWCIITQYIDSTIVCDTTGYVGFDGGTKMKTTYGWSSNGNGTNTSGFSALPGGSMGIYHFDDLYLKAYFWSTTEDYPGYAWFRKLSYGLPRVGKYFSTKSRSYSVRCVKN